MDDANAIVTLEGLDFSSLVKGDLARLAELGAATDNTVMGELHKRFARDDLRDAGLPPPRPNFDDEDFEVPNNVHRLFDPKATPVATWEDQIQRGKPGKGEAIGPVLLNQFNVILILENHEAWKGKFRLDMRSQRVLVGPCPACEAESVIEDEHLVAIARWFGATGYASLGYKSEHLLGALILIANQNAFDPVRDMFDSLSWDGVSRMDELVRRLGAQESHLHSAYVTNWMISAVARTYRPGCQADAVLVLTGKQGTGKSSALRALAMEDSWFLDRLPNIEDVKTSGQTMLGKLIVEMAELDAMGKKESSAVKAFLSAREDDFRTPYKTFNKSHKRRLVFAGTTNHQQFLRDETGGRRFWPIETGAIDLTWILENRAQLWAEAVSMFNAGMPWHLVDQALIDASTRSQEERREIDPWAEKVEDYVEAQRDGLGLLTRITVKDVLEHVLMIPVERWGRAEETRVSKILQSMGLVRKQRMAHGERRWAYEFPEAVS